MKYNLREIMTGAWSIRRMTGCAMSTALRQSWSEAKKPSYLIKGWFLSKNFTSSERIAISGEKATLVRETEKAVQLSWSTDCGKIVRWVPKSCLETAKSLATENTAEKCAARLEAINASQASYDSLIAECRAHGIPARKGWKASTMRQKLAEVA